MWARPPPCTEGRGCGCSGLGTDMGDCLPSPTPGPQPTACLGALTVGPRRTGPAHQPCAPRTRSSAQHQRPQAVPGQWAQALRGPRGPEPHPAPLVTALDRGLCHENAVDKRRTHVHVGRSTQVGPAPTGGRTRPANDCLLPMTSRHPPCLARPRPVTPELCKGRSTRGHGQHPRTQLKTPERERWALRGPGRHGRQTHWRACRPGR